MLFTGDTVARAPALLDAICARFAARVFDKDGETFGASGSFGLAVRGPGAQTPGELMDLADRALYAAKDRGGNTIVQLSDVVAA